MAPRAQPQAHGAFPAPSTSTSSTGAGSSSGLHPQRRATRAACVGLHNLGNTCYVNAMLQALASVPEFVEAVRGAVWTTTGEGRATVGPLLADALDQLLCVGGQGSGQDSGRRPQQPCFRPQALLDAVRAADDHWADRTQQDGQEFLAWFLQRLLGEMVPGCSAARALQALLGGQLLGTTTCGAQGCGRCSHKQDPLFGSLQVELPEPAAAGWTQASGGGRGRGRGGSGSGSGRGNGSSGGAVSVQDCMAAFVEPSQLRGADRIYCERCGQRRDASRRLLVDECPPLLILALKRFAWMQDAWGGYSARKVCVPVSMSAARRLELARYCAPAAARATPVYELVAVVDHAGDLGSGHYTARCRLPSGDWRLFDDTRTAHTPAPAGADCAAYVLLYRLQQQ
jgi:ubiquitin C-terminal hydrolase